MGRVLAVTNQKGGVGKTTTSVNLASALGLRGLKVLLIDLDPQSNATVASGLDKNALAATSGDWLLGDIGADVVVSTDTYDIVPTDGDLTAAEVGLIGMGGAESNLREQLTHLRSAYEYVLIDCPPALNMLTINALVAADGVLIPLQCEYFALEGLSALLETVEGVRARANPGLYIEGLLRTMYDPRNSLTRDVSRQLLSHFGARVYRTVIPRNVRLAEAPSHGLPVTLYDRSSRGAAAYETLAAEIVRRHARATADAAGSA